MITYYYEFSSVMQITLKQTRN